MRIAVFLSCISFAFAPAAGAQAQFRWLEPLPGLPEASRATGISANGCVILGQSGSRTVRWTAGAVAELPRFAQPPAASADGSLLVGIAAQPPPWGQSWFVEDHGVALRVSPPTGSNGLFLGAVSADGRVAVGGTRWGDPTHAEPDDAVRYEGGGFTTLAARNSSGGAFARAVSADGSVVVGYQGSSAFRWEAGTLFDLGFGDGISVSADGSVVVGQWGDRASLWAGGARLDLGPGQGKALDTSADGSTTVGYAGVPSQISVTTAVVWREPEGQLAVTDLLASWGIEAASLQLREATAIADDALAIAGNGVDDAGRPRAWLATRGARDCPSASDPPIPVPSPPPLLVPTLFPFFPWLGSGVPWIDLFPLANTVTPDGVSYVYGTAVYQDGSTGEIRFVDGIHEIAPENGSSRTLVEGDFGGFRSVAADGESVVAAGSDRLIRAARPDGSPLADAALGPYSSVASGPALDPRGNAFASAETVTSVFQGEPCAAVAVLTRRGYAGMLSDGDGSPCIGVPGSLAEWHRGALHLWTAQELWRLAADGTRSLVLSAGEGLSTIGPHGFDAAGNLFVVDPEALVVYRITPAGERSVILDRDGDLVGHPLDESPVWLDLVVDPRGHVLVSDWRRIFEIFPNGAIQLVASPNSWEGPRVLLPDGAENLELDAAGNLYAAMWSGILALPPSTEVPEPAVPDRDGDAFPDAADNCDVYPNPEQRDRDADGHGDLCDADFDQNGVVGGSDLARVGAAFGSRTGDARYDPALDMDSDGVIGSFEYLALARSFGGAPGGLRP